MEDGVICYSLKPTEFSDADGYYRWELAISRTPHLRLAVYDARGSAPNPVDTAVSLAARVSFRVAGISRYRRELPAPPPPTPISSEGDGSISCPPPQVNAPDRYRAGAWRGGRRSGRPRAATIAMGANIAVISICGIRRPPNGRTGLAAEAASLLGSRPRSPPPNIALYRAGVRN